MGSQLLSTTVERRQVLPESYIRPECERPRLAEVTTDSGVPLIDLASPDKQRVIAQIGLACRTYGFFQVINHGIEEEQLEKMMAVGLQFFRLPPEEKEKLYSDEPSKKVRLSTSFNIRKETVRNWRDYLRLHCHPLEEFLPEWPSNPESFKEIVSAYCREVRLLGIRLLGMISLSLGLQEGYIENALGEQEQHMAVNYYPQCPEPDLTYGLPKHTDPNALTILLQDPNVAGLQVLKKGGGGRGGGGDQWIAVSPRPNALVINLGDQLQALSNGAYKSVWHRAVVNDAQERMSVASFLCPCNSAVISPAAALVVRDGDAPVYRSYTYDEYYNKFWSRSLDDQEHCLDLFRSTQPGQ